MEGVRPLDEVSQERGGGDRHKERIMAQVVVQMQTIDLRKAELQPVTGRMSRRFRHC